MGVQTDLRAGWRQCDRCGLWFETDIDFDLHVCL
jgi:hypothetical protein